MVDVAREEERLGECEDHDALHIDDACFEAGSSERCSRTLNLFQIHTHVLELNSALASSTLVSSACEKQLSTGTPWAAGSDDEGSS